jgi:amino acid adenylation domain-containing protein
MKTLSFGPNEQLLGILHETESTGKDLIALTWNVGICSRTGPNRLNVDIAQALASQGIASFRFDLGNLGDSLAGSAETDVIRRNKDELALALNMLAERFGYSRFLLIGICSSAVDAHHAAVEDPRVVGLVMVDTYVYPTPKSRRSYVLGRLFKPQSWKRVAHRKYRDWSGESERMRAQEAEAEAETDKFEGVYPDQVATGLELQALVDRGVPMLVIYTGGFQHVYTYENQFLDMFPDVAWNGRLNLKHRPRADHLYTIVEDREEFLSELKAWTTDHALAPKPPVATSGRTLLDVIAEIDAYPSSQVAIEDQERRITYGELSAQSLGLSAYFAQQGLTESSLVGLCLDRSPELIASLLGILRSGHAYLPLDPHYPKDRLATMIDLAQCQLVLCHRAHAALYRDLGVKTLVWEDIAPHLIARPLPRPSVDAHTPAYVIFTSGSTGKPKGVVLGHRALTQLLDWHRLRYPKPRPRTLQFTPISFDVSFQEILTTLHAGGTLRLIAEELRLDPISLLDELETSRIERLFLPFVALQFLAESAVALGRKTYLEEVFTAGEALKTTPALRSFFKALPSATLHNHYGPSETHVITAYELPKDPDTWAPLPPIGQAIEGSFVRLLDSDTLHPVATGEEGELFLGGLSLAEGYIHRPDLTDERFIKDPLHPSERLYRTGDRGRLTVDGDLEFLGRRDGQIKIRGHRIELGEIEAQLGEFPGAGQLIVDGRMENDQVYLVAYYRDELNVVDLKAHAAARMPEAMRPSHYIRIDDFPRTPSGKIDRKALPSPFSSERPSGKAALGAPVSDLRSMFRSLWAEILPSSDFHDDQNFFDAGGTSLLAMRFVTLLKQRFDVDVRVRDVFAKPSINALAGSFEPKPKESKKPEAIESPNSPIAIIGMAIDAPGAPDLEAFWSLLDQGREGLKRFTPEELDENVPLTSRNDPNYVPVRGVIAHPEGFDHEFFAIGKREAELIDPQQRRLLQLCWQALEDAGLSETASATKCGVFAGTGYNSYILKQLMQNPAVLERSGDFQVMLANDKDYAATRIAYKLNLKGPALSIHTACSTSLVAVIAAVQSLRRGECEVALAGAMSVQFPSKAGHIYSEGGILSRDGHCRPYDAEASGTVFCDGGGIVTLKRLADAERDGDRIYSVIRGAAWNNDGSEKASFSAPSLSGQGEVIRAAIADAQIPAKTIQYIEGHGTATPIGDPLEWEALRLTFEEAGVVAPGSVTLGSVKGNVGHTTASAGVIGLIKTSLALYRQKIPGTLHFQTLNPEIEAGPFQVRAISKAWPRRDAEPRRAGISSFGVGGTNAHVVIEGAHVETETKSGELTVLTLSNRTKEGLERTKARTQNRLNDTPNLGALAKALSSGRRHFHERTTVIVNAAGEIFEGPTGQTAKKTLVWAFPGQGSQLWGMGQDLHRNDSLFRAIYDELALRIETLTGLNLKAAYWSSPKAPITDTRVSQLGLFAIGYALGQSLLQRGIRPDVMIGHSVGEWVAASLSGVFHLDDAIKILDLRGSLMQQMPVGSMLSVRSSLAEAMEYKPAEVDLAASNALMQQVFSGPREAIDDFATKLTAQGIASRMLEAKHAFHSWMVEPICSELEKKLRHIAWQPMQIPLVSSVHGDWLTEASVHDPAYWASHARVPVQFHKAIQKIAELGDTVLCEMGPRAVITHLSRKELSQNSKALTALGEENEAKAFGTLLSEIWVTGLCSSSAMIPANSAGRAPGIAYEFALHSAWVQAAPPAGVTRPIAMAAANEHKGIETMRIAKISDDIRALVEESSGEVIDQKDDETHFTELGLDSLFLTQLSLQLRNRFKVEISFRQLMEELSSISSIARYVEGKAPQEAMSPGAPLETEAKAPTAPALPRPALPATASIAAPVVAVPAPQGISALFNQQLQVMQAQLALLGGQPVSYSPFEAAPPSFEAARPISAVTDSQAQVSRRAELKSAEDDYDDPAKKVFGAMARIAKTSDKLGDLQKENLETFRAAYNAKTKSSKSRTQASRSYMADPRVVTGFKPALKEMIYPILIERSKGVELWDIDGNRYVDMLNGFGSNFFGYSPEFITEALKKQIDEGYELGPQHPLALEASALAAELTGFDRVAWCNTGSEAVLGAMRIARTVTGRMRIASFTGSYHGINDEVILRGSKSLKSFAAAPGIMNAAVQNMLVLDYGTEESLKILRENCHDLAAVLIEPAQSRRPDFRPLEFLREVRRITEQHGTVLIFDEVITGFRYHSGGFQTALGIRADIGTYGKVVGGGMPIGMIAGKRKFMDALDGGHWQYGDQSIPEVGVTYFAGTFVRHPMALAAATATMRRLKQAGPALHEALNAKADRFCAELNRAFKRLDAPYEYTNFGTLMKLKVTDESRGYPELLATWLRHKGVHIWDGFPTFITCAHTDEQLSWVTQQFIDAIQEMKRGGLLGENKAGVFYTDSGAKLAPNHPQAKLGVDDQGQAAWFVPDADRPGHYKQLVIE